MPEVIIPKQARLSWRRLHVEPPVQPPIQVNPFEGPWLPRIEGLPQEPRVDLIHRLASLPKTIGDKLHYGKGDWIFASTYIALAVAGLGMQLVASALRGQGGSVEGTAVQEPVGKTFSLVNKPDCNNSEQIGILNAGYTISRGQFMEITQNLLKESDPFVNGKSFESVLNGMGYKITDAWQNCPAIVMKAGPDGWYRRERPAPVDSSLAAPKPEYPVNWGWDYISYAGLEITNPETNQRYYIDVAEPWSWGIGENKTWPTVVRRGDSKLPEQPFQQYGKAVGFLSSQDGSDPSKY